MRAASKAFLRALENSRRRPVLAEAPRKTKCELCGLGQRAPRHRNRDMQAYHQFEDPAPDARYPPLAAPGDGKR